MCFVKIVILNLNTSRKRLFAIVSVVLSPYSERYYSFHYFAFFYLIRLDVFLFLYYKCLMPLRYAFIINGSNTIRKQSVIVN